MLDKGGAVHGEGSIAIIASGITVWTALEAQQMLNDIGIASQVIDLFRLKPTPVGFLAAVLLGKKKVVSVEENCRSGALGSIVAEVACDTGYLGKIKRLSLGDRYLMGATGRKLAAKRYHIDVESIVDAVRSL